MFDEDNLLDDFLRLKRQYQQAPYLDYSLRRKQLKQLKVEIMNHRDALIDALNDDYGKRNAFDTLLCEILPTISHLNYSLKHLKKWMKPSRRKVGALLFPSTARVHQQPLGVVGIMVPWNFPVYLGFSPLITALAAGNRVMLKLSEHTPKTNFIIEKILAALDDYVLVVHGGLRESEAFTQLPFDHLFFTGSTNVGRLVARAASQNLTPVTLELGGKSPVILTESANFKQAVEKIMLGKVVNAGQICVAPDHVFVPKSRENEFIEHYIAYFECLFKQQKRLSQLTSIVNAAQDSRLHHLLADAKLKGAQVYSPNPQLALSQRQWLPHLLTRVTEDMQIMQEEIFGPLLPVISYDNLSDVISEINEGERPLALYLMSTDKEEQLTFIEQTHSGGMGINEVLLQVIIDDAPFGGVGSSGMGHYHGYEGFCTFSKAKTVMQTQTWLPRSRWLLKYQGLFYKLIKWFFIR